MAKKTNPSLRSWLVIALVVFTFFTLYRLNPNPPKARELTVLEFYQALESGKIVLHAHQQCRIQLLSILANS